MLDPFADNPYLTELYSRGERATDDLAPKVELTLGYDGLPRPQADTLHVVRPWRHGRPG
ncbi:hypothetical protein [Micromonospora sp. NPDC023814]|uniref:hypothetical protein n=1 Tax=Micromonospora sp. NPDC023814 TaxID=3154596 RepID=UPI00340E3CE3